MGSLFQTGIPRKLLFLLLLVVVVIIQFSHQSNLVTYTGDQETPVSLDVWDAFHRS